MIHHLSYLRGGFAPFTVLSHAVSSLLLAIAAMAARGLDLTANPVSLWSAAAAVLLGLAVLWKILQVGLEDSLSSSR